MTVLLLILVFVGLFVIVGLVARIENALPTEIEALPLLKYDRELRRKVEFKLENKGDEWA